MLRKFITAGLFIVSISLANAQQTAETTATEKESTSFKISGVADVYYRYDFGESISNNKTSFTSSQNAFQLGMISTKLEKTIGKVGLVADLGFGQRAKEISFNETGISQAVKQLYATYAATEKLTLTAGSFATHIGYELLDPHLNKNYSMGYMFSYGPFVHTGIKADYKITGTTGVMLGIANPTDVRSAVVGSKYLLGQISTGSNDGKVKAWLNYQGGKPDTETKLRQVDLVASYVPGTPFSVSVNATLSSFVSKNSTGKFSEHAKWWGVAAYGNYDATDKLGIAFRSEFFDDQDGLTVFKNVTPGKIWANTLSANIKIKNLVLVPELRAEHATEKLFVGADQSEKKSSFSALLAAVYSF